MSLLLDALKKAAEQKAQKAKAEEQAGQSSDETVMNTALEDATELQSSDDSNLQVRQSAREDETEMDDSDFNTRFERVQGAEGSAEDTRTEIVDEAEILSAQMQTGEDETIIIADEDVSDFLGEPQFVNRAAETGDDQTLMDSTDVQTRFDPSQEPREVEDETVYNETEYSPPTESQEADSTQYEYTEQATRADTSDSDQVEFADETRQVAEATQTSIPEETETTENADVTLADITEAPDDDLSLILADREETSLTARTSLTDPQSAGDHARILRAEDNDELALVDKTQLELPDEPTDLPSQETRTSATATTGVALDTLTTESTTTRADSTSTRTYAPDNYDRTLMKLPGEDASKLFAGMKSDADVVMTPDYAKKVFRSKSSAQRLQHYKIYGGIALAILLAIGVFGLFEMQEETFNIESSLRPLKRDPMPGVIRSGEEKEQSLFGETGVDAKTIELVQSAENGIVTEESAEGSAVDSGAAVATAGGVQDEVEALLEPEDANISGTIASDSSTAATSQPVTREFTIEVKTADAGQTSVPTSGVIADENAAAIAGSQADNPNLHIVSSRRLEEKHGMLREAYQAYQAGNDELALAKYNEVLEIDPNNRNALLARAAINVQNNNVGAAIADYRQILLANPKDTLAMTSLIAVANVSPADAESRLKLMIRDDPDSPYLNFALANAYGAQNRWREAQTHYFTALENNPGDPNYAYNLAVSLEHIAKPKVAVDYYRRALDNMSNGLAMFNREVVDQRLETLGKL